MKPQDLIPGKRYKNSNFPKVEYLACCSKGSGFKEFGCPPPTPWRGTLDSNKFMVVLYGPQTGNIVVQPRDEEDPFWLNFYLSN
jgi:hypothetical protein